MLRISFLLPRRRALCNTILYLYCPCHWARRIILFSGPEKPMDPMNHSPENIRGNFDYHKIFVKTAHDSMLQLLRRNNATESCCLLQQGLPIPTVIQGTPKSTTLAYYMFFIRNRFIRTPVLKPKHFKKGSESNHPVKKLFKVKKHYLATETSEPGARASQDFPKK